MIPCYAWVIATALLILASLINDNNFVCLMAASACAGTAAAAGLSLLPPIWFEILLFSSSILLCLVFVNGPPTGTCRRSESPSEHGYRRSPDSKT